MKGRDNERRRNGGNKYMKSKQTGTHIWGNAYYKRRKLEDCTSS